MKNIKTPSNTSSIERVANQQNSCCSKASCCAAPETVKYNQPKIGRNEPCPCGNDLKYKKCCGKNS